MCRITLIALSFILYEQNVFTYTIDQRQTGDLNVQVDLKNLNLIALMKGKEDYVDYDYAYDYSDITIKPQNGTTKKPLNVTETVTQGYKGNDTTTTSVPEQGLVTNVSEVTSTSTPATTLTENSGVTTVVTDVNIKTENTTPSVIKNENTTPSVTMLPQNVDTANTSTTTVAPECKKGFFRNSQGNCALRLQNPSNTLLKMIKQKPKANGGSQSRHSR